MLNEIWNKVLINIQSNINKQSYDMWFKNTEPLSINDTTVIIKVPDEVTKKHIDDYYRTVICDIIKGITGKDYTFEFIAKSDEKIVSETDEPIVSMKKSSVGTPATVPLMLNPSYTFDNFVIGSNNQLAHAAAVSVSKAPGVTYNPLFIYGGVGLGKTHLMQAIGHFIIKEKPFLKVLYVQSEQFVNEFVHSIRTGTMDSFKIKYRNVDILLIDDIQFLEKKEQTQEEIFHTFNTLHQNKKQIVISSDRPPKDLSNLEARLISRFAWGLIVDIQPPNLEIREAILKNKAEKENLEISDDVINFIAIRIKQNIRQLESALSKLKFIASNSNEPITIKTAKIHLKDLFDPDAEKKVTILDIKQRVSELFDITIDDMISKSRQNKVVQPRFIAMHISRLLTDMTTVDIGREFGDRDHTTVLHACDKIEQMMADDEQFKQQILDIISDLKR